MPSVWHALLWLLGFKSRMDMTLFESSKGPGTPAIMLQGHQQPLPSPISLENPTQSNSLPDILYLVLLDTGWGLHAPQALSSKVLQDYR